MNKEKYNMMLYDSEWDCFFRIKESDVAKYVKSTDIFIQEFIPLTADTLTVLRMVHPCLDICGLEVSLKSWDDFNIDDVQEDYYVYQASGGKVWE